MVGILQKGRNRAIQRKFILIVLAFGVASVVNNLFAQDLTSIKALDSAKIDFKLGRLDKAMNFLNEAEALQASRQVKAEIFLYKARIHSLQYNSAQANEYTKKFVVITPFFKFDEDEQSEILLVARKSKISPRLGLGVSYTINSLGIQTFGTSSLISSSDYTYLNNTSHFYDFSVGLNADWYFHRITSVYGELNFTQFNFQRTSVVGSMGETETYFNLNYLQIPIGLKIDIIPIYFFTRAVILNFNVSGGFYGSRLYNSAAYTGGFKDFRDDLNAKLMDNYFNNYLYGYWASASVAYRLKKFKFSVSFRYQHDFVDVNNELTRYALGTGDELLFNHYQIVDDMRFSNIGLQFGINYYIRYKIFRELFYKRKF